MFQRNVGFVLVALLGIPAVGLALDLRPPAVVSGGVTVGGSNGGVVVPPSAILPPSVQITIPGLPTDGLIIAIPPIIIPPIGAAPTPPPDCTQVNGADADGDGVSSFDCGGSDCDDSDASRYPGGTEVCDANGHDEDCDATTFGTTDLDQDGAISSQCCNTDSVGGPHCGSDCDDHNQSVRGGNVEVCNGLDDDCNGVVDDGVLVTLYPDMDGDNHGVPGDSHQGCAGEAGSTILGNDCDDENPAIQPGAMICLPEKDVSATRICNPFETPRVPAGSYVEASCPQGRVCFPQPNGTGYCKIVSTGCLPGVLCHSVP